MDQKTMWDGTKPTRVQSAVKYARGLPAAVSQPVQQRGKPEAPGSVHVQSGTQQA